MCSVSKSLLFFYGGPIVLSVLARKEAFFVFRHQLNPSYTTTGAYHAKNLWRTIF